MPDPAKGFPPISLPDARLLILGSMPGQASLAARQYYAHPRNAFWPIMGRLLGFDPAAAYADRATALRAAGIALWDVVHSCARPGSLDASIDRDSARINDFAAFFAAHPGISQVFFNGATAESLFRKAVLPSLAAPPDLLRLPSTSPAHAALSFERKLAAWQEAIGPAGPPFSAVPSNSGNYRCP
jgi:TDG/mug DNA glycosylase family protein